MMKKPLILVAFVGILAIGIFWYLFVPTGTARVRIVTLLVYMYSPDIQRELLGTLRGVDFVVSNFYVENDRMPNPIELRSVRITDQELAWAKYGKDRYGRERYYHYGYEDGECTFVVEGIPAKAGMEECFEKVYLDAFAAAQVRLEHKWLLADRECSKKLDYPELILIEDFTSSSACVQVLEDLKWRRPELYQQIRNELELEIQEGSYDENLCVLSKPFQERMARRKEEQQASHVESSVATDVE